jgi:hypothetical protein
MYDDDALRAYALQSTTDTIPLVWSYNKTVELELKPILGALWDTEWLGSSNGLTYGIGHIMICNVTDCMRSAGATPRFETRWMGQNTGVMKSVMGEERLAFMHILQHRQDLKDLAMAEDRLCKQEQSSFSKSSANSSHSPTIIKFVETFKSVWLERTIEFASAHPRGRRQLLIGHRPL